MPPPVKRINLVNPKTGEVRSVSEGTDLGRLIDLGWTVETQEAGAGRAVVEGRKTTTPSALKTGARGFVRGFTSGISDVIETGFGSDEAAAENIKLGREAHPVADIGGEIVGTAAQIALPGGGAATTVRAGEAAASSIAKRALTDAAISGAQGAGYYMSDVALGDRDLTAEGFLGSVGSNALLGGGTSAAIGITERGLFRARTMFPQSTVTREAAEAGERQATSAITGVLDDTDELVKRGDAAVGDIKKVRAADPLVVEERAKRAAARAQQDAARTAKLQADALHAENRAALSTKRLEEANAPRVRGSKRVAAEPIADDAASKIIAKYDAPAISSQDDVAEAMAGHVPSDAVPEVVAPDRAAIRSRLEDGMDAAPAPGVVDPVTAPVAPVATVPSLEDQLAATSQRLSAGEDIGAINAETIAAIPPRGRSKPLTGDDAIAASLRGETATLPSAAVDDLEDAVLAVDPDARKIRALTNEVREAREEARKVLTPREWAAQVNERAAAKAEAQIATGAMSREDDVLYGVADDGILGAKTGTAGRRSGLGPDRSVTSRMRNPYTDDELIAQAAERPLWRDAGGDVIGSRSELAERIITGKTNPRTLEIDELVKREIPDAATGEIRSALGTVTRPATADDIINSVSRSKYATEDLMTALRGKLDAADMPKSIAVLQRLEKAEHDLVQALGPRANPASAARAAEYAAAQASHTETLALGQAQRGAAIADRAGGDIAAMASAAKATEAVGAADAVAGKAHNTASRVADFAAGLELLGSAGIPGLPSARDIPVIGPVLSLYLHARAGATIWKKMGGRLPASIEAAVAKKSAATRDRLNKAVRAMLTAGEKGARMSRSVVPRMAVTLAQPLFSETKTKPRNETVAESFERQRTELVAAKQPGAVERVMRERIPTGDPRLADGLATAIKRRLAYLDAKMPRPPADNGFPSDGAPWQPTPAQTEQWSRIVSATDDPAGVIERAATSGDVSLDEIEAVRAVYPRLYQEAQMALIEGASDGPPIPYQRRIQLGVLFGMPLAPTQDPAFIAGIQASYAQQSQQEQQSQPPSARASANVDFGKSALLQEQKP